MKTKVIKFKRDTKFRKQFFIPDSFSHPAKMDSQLLIWLVNRFTKEGETILDPMFGSGTTMLACTLGRHVIGVELEQKYLDMANDNWEKARQKPMLGITMGNCTILQGDARNLEGLLADAIITSPPHGGSGEPYYSGSMVRIRKEIGRDISKPSQQTEGYGNNKDNIGNLPYGSIDAVVTSPPYAENTHHSDDPKELEYLTPGRRARVAGTAGESRDNIGNLRYGEIDSIITSPPYAAEQVDQRKTFNDTLRNTRQSPLRLLSYSENNIGNLKGESYLSAMLEVYQQCHIVLRPQGLMILVVKNFIRDKAIVRLDSDTIKLCEEAGFELKERHTRQLMSMSFWRRIYHQKYPDVEPITHEDILVFRKYAQSPAGSGRSAIRSTSAISGGFDL